MKQAYDSKYREILRDELSRRQGKNPSYSQRAFAKFLGMSSARLNEVLVGKKGLSTLAGSKIGQRLGMSKKELSTFCDLIEASHARKKDLRSKAVERLINQNHKNFSVMETDQFNVVSKWHHFAILELLRLKPKASSSADLSRYLGLKTSAVEEALERLLKMGLVEKTSSGWMSGVQTTVPGDISSKAVHSFHEGVLNQALNALDAKPHNETEFSSTFLSIQKDRLPVAQAMIKQFWKDMCTAMDEVPDHDDVYCLSTQFFSILKESPQ